MLVSSNIFIPPFALPVQISAIYVARGVPFVNLETSLESASYGQWKMVNRCHCPSGRSTVRNEYSREQRGDCGTLTRCLTQHSISTLSPYLALTCIYQFGERSLAVISAIGVAYLIED